ncbi:acyl-CoA dehydrogenase family protein [Bradyrhizobium tropiciagri]|uniref:acyl-CoA dehydrogenase family protein n=1 Tax=Bradyrhizobium tropiciagri TaxID=312253 RepID=UPI001BAC0C60|nr:acyl-CoA dehydrogenase family protein [Bradyrhizobium tropiciagri]MBR0899038.1 acyl-CoA dehydrogenase family protein [Bradyrhizobium tropiciagri]
MDFNLPGEDDPRRLAVRKWFEANPSPSYAQLAKQGYVVPHWPEPWGLGAEPELQLIIDQEIERAGIVHPMTFNVIAINQCGQSLLTHGTKDQRQKFLPPALACEERWCMLFSEPSGGSDLGNLRTTARRDGDHYIINGQKIWNSMANKSQIGVLIARTDPEAPKHRGLSVFLIDMKTLGVLVRPIVDMTGEEPEYNEVFLTDVKVSADRLLGKEGDGWRIVMEQLQTERMHMTKPGAVWGGGPTARELMSGLIQTGKINDPLIRDEAGKLFVEGELLRLLSLRNLSNRINGKPAGAEGNIGKMLASPHGQNLSDLAKRSQGAAGMVRDRSVLPLPPKEYGLFDNWDYAYWFAPAATLGVGTQEILKNAVAERVLGLPRELDPTASLPFNQAKLVKPKGAN